MKVEKLPVEFLKGLNEIWSPAVSFAAQNLKYVLRKGTSILHWGSPSLLLPQILTHA